MGILDFFSQEAGQNRRRWLDGKTRGILEDLQYYAGPGVDVEQAGGILSMFNPVNDMGQSMADYRDGDYVGSAVNAATALAPVGLYKMAGAGSLDDATNAMMDFFTGINMKTQGAMDAGRQFAGDEFGGVGPGGKAKPRMIAHHNTTAEKLKFTDELGGMPYPSIAISRTDAPLTNFGDISLIGSPNMATPSRSNKVFPGDGYTIRQPRGDIGLVDDAAFSKAFSSDPRFSHLKDATYWHDMYDDIGRADDALKQVEAAIYTGKVDPKDFERWDDLSRAARKAMRYKPPEGAYDGIAQFGDTERTLFQGYTPSGNRKKPKPYTLDNVMSAMRKDAKNAGAEQMNYGASSFRANANPPFRNFSEVKANRGRLAPESDTNEIYESFSNKYGRVVGEVADESGIDGFSAHDAAGEFMNDYASGRNLQGWRGSWTDNLSPEYTLGEIDKLAEEARNLPVNYFEAKPQRAVSLGEFDAAIVPEDAAEAIEILKNSGVREILTYGSPEQRKELFKRFPALEFVIAGGAVGLGALGTQQADADPRQKTGLLDF